MTRQNKRVKADVSQPSVQVKETSQAGDGNSAPPPRISSPTEQPRFLSMADAAERYGVHYKLINMLVNDEALPSIRLS